MPEDSNPDDTTLTASTGRLKPVTESLVVPTLTLVFGHDPDRFGERMHPGSEPVTLGRHASVFPKGPLNDPEMSRQHARISRNRDGRFGIRDLGSKNGTWIGDVRCRGEDTILVDGDLLRVGNTLLMFHNRSVVSPEDSELAGFIGCSDDARIIRSTTIQYASRKDSPVLIYGESGTGKELIASALTRLGRPGKPSVSFNSGTGISAMIDSTLFGHVKGAFTDASDDRPGLFMSAHTGTLFLDEVGELPPETQVRLLRVLEEKMVTPLGSTRPISVDVRVIAATNRDLAVVSAQGRFRTDLYSRLAVLEINIPPLREHVEDVPILALHFSGGRAFTTDAMTRLLAHPWPLNVRELKSVVEQSIADASSSGPLSLSASVTKKLDKHQKLFVQDQSTHKLDREAVQDALEKAHGKVARAAEALGKDRSQFYRIMKKLGLHPDEFR